MYQEIKRLADEALKLQNKNFMDETFAKIIAVCDDATCQPNTVAAMIARNRVGLPVLTLTTTATTEIGPVQAALLKKYAEEDAIEAARQMADAELLKSAPGGFATKEVAGAIEPGAFKWSPVYEQQATYGEAKSYDSEAEMIADIQGRPSAVFPLPNAPRENPVVLGKQPQNILGERDTEADKIVAGASSEFGKLAADDDVQKLVHDGLNRQIDSSLMMIRDRIEAESAADAGFPKFGDGIAAQMQPYADRENARLRELMGVTNKPTLADYSTSVAIPHSADPELAAAVKKQSLKGGAK